MGHPLAALLGERIIICVRDAARVDDLLAGFADATKDQDRSTRIDARLIQTPSRAARWGRRV